MESRFRGRTDSWRSLRRSCWVDFTGAPLVLFRHTVRSGSGESGPHIHLGKEKKNQTVIPDYAITNILSSQNTMLICKQITCVSQQYLGLPRGYDKSKGPYPTKSWWTICVSEISYLAYFSDFKERSKNSFCRRLLIRSIPNANLHFRSKIYL